MEKVLFVCLGNICRSPLAEGLAKKMAQEMKLENVMFDSCGTSGYHIGEDPDYRTINNARDNGLELAHKARQFEKSDFRRFDHILAMDSANLANIRKLDMTDAFGSKVRLMRDYDVLHRGADVPDPYLSGTEGFQNVYEILERSVKNFLKKGFPQV